MKTYKIGVCVYKPHRFRRLLLVVLEVPVVDREVGPEVPGILLVGTFRCPLFRGLSLSAYMSLFSLI